MRILVGVGDRADKALSAPIIKRLNKSDKIDCEVVYLMPGNIIASYMLVEAKLNTDIYDLVFCTGDRVEMAAAANCAFHNNIKIAHFYAGILNPSFKMFDCIDRHIITLQSDIQFVESKDAGVNVCKLLNSIQKIPQCYNVGISHLDDIEIDESALPKEPYDLILINAVTRHKHTRFDVYKDLLNIDFLDKKIQIGSNADGDMIPLKNCEYFKTLPRPIYLGLLKNCNRFISNSSDIYYMAPALGLKPEQIIQVGLRNINRESKGPFLTGASDKIVKVLEELKL